MVDVRSRPWVEAGADGPLGRDWPAMRTVLICTLTFAAVAGGWRRVIGLAALMLVVGRGGAAALPAAPQSD